MKLSKNKNSRRRIWIDMDNSPHVPFFKPIIDKLETEGYEVILTARDCFQVCDLADLYHLNYKKIGRHYGKNKIKKMIGLVIRALQLMPFVLKTKPDLAISHGSRAQMLLAWMLGIPTGLIMDYEFIKTFPFIRLDAIIAPEAIGGETLSKYNGRLHKYPGIKEHVYASNFKPDLSLRKDLGIEEDQVMVVVRPPANEAHYHNPRSEAYFEKIMDHLASQENTRVVILPRNERQEKFIRNRWLLQLQKGIFIIPDRVFNGLNLIWNADLVISGGGTMNREAAALGVPVYSIFQGKMGGVDKYLSEQGRLMFLHTDEDFKNIRLTRRNISDTKPEDKSQTLNVIVQTIIALVEKE